jgi:ABC-type uncharacterized transport system substrate-binding protein
MRMRSCLLATPHHIAASQIVEFAAQNRMPTIYHRTEFVDAGGLMSYGPNYNELFREAAKYVDRILKARSLETCQ